MAAPKLRWVQADGAGMDKALTPELVTREEITVTNMAGLYAVQVADETGNTTFPLNVVKDSTLTITISGPELNAVTLEIPVK